MKRLTVVLLCPLVLPGIARANGDPASDVLPVSQVFLPYEAPISKSAANDLRRTVSDANQKGYKIRAAVIAFTSDLGSARSLWDDPQNYAKFLGSEVTFAYAGPILIAMPGGFGFYNGRKPVAKELQVLKSVPVGKTPTPLAESAAAAVRALAAATGVKVAKPAPPKSSATRDRLILGVAVLAFVLVLVFPARLLRRRGRGAEQSPSSEPR